MDPTGLMHPMHLDAPDAGIEIRKNVYMSAGHVTIAPDAGIEIRKNVYMSAGHVTMSD